MDKYCDNNECNEDAKHFFQSVDVNGKINFHKLCNDCFYKMLEENYDI